MREWSKDDIARLRRAQKSVQPSEPSCWAAVARQVPGKSAAECCERWFEEFNSTSMESLTSKETKKAAKESERRAEEAVAAVSEAARAVSGSAEVEGLRKARSKLKRALKGLARVSAPAPLKKRRDDDDDVFQTKHRPPSLARALDRAAAVSSPERTTGPKAPPEPTAPPKAFSWRPGRAYIAKLQRRRRPRQEGGQKTSLAPERLVVREETHVGSVRGSAVVRNNGEVAISLVDEIVEEEEDDEDDIVLTLRQEDD